MRRLSSILGEATLSFNKSISFPEPPKGFKVSFVGSPPIESLDADSMVQDAYNKGKNETTEFYRNEIKQLRESYATRQDQTLSGLSLKANEVLGQLDERLPDLVMGIVERVIGKCPMDKTTVEEMVKSMIKEFADEQEQLEVFLSPEDLSLLKSMADSEKEPEEDSGDDEGFASAIAGIFDGLDGDDALLEGYPNVKFFEDSTLASGDCQVKSRFGLLDGRIATKLRKVEEELRGND